MDFVDNKKFQDCVLEYNKKNLDDILKQFNIPCNNYNEFKEIVLKYLCSHNYSIYLTPPFIVHDIIKNIFNKTYETSLTYK